MSARVPVSEGLTRLATILVVCAALVVAARLVFSPPRPVVIYTEAKAGR